MFLFEILGDKSYIFTKNQKKLGRYGIIKKLHMAIINLTYLVFLCQYLIQS